jgi:hypothetical protein
MSSPSHNSEDGTLNVIISAAGALLKQYRELLQQIDNLPDPTAAITFHSKMIPLSTPGKHIRHVLDHYHHLLVGTSPTAQFNTSSHANPDNEHMVSLELTAAYDTRRRDVPAEKDVAAALEYLDDILTMLNNIPNNDHVTSSTTVKVQSTVDPSLPFLETHSTFARELWFVSGMQGAFS